MEETDKDKRIKELEEENARLKKAVTSLRDQLSSKTAALNRIWHDDFERVDYDRDRDR